MAKLLETLSAEELAQVLDEGESSTADTSAETDAAIEATNASNEVDASMETLEDGLDEAESIAETKDNLDSLAETESAKEGTSEPLSTESIALIAASREALKSASRHLGLEYYGPSVSTEGLDDCTYSTLQISREDADNIFQKAWEGIKKFFSWLGEKIANMWDAVLRFLGIRDKKIEEVAKENVELEKKTGADTSKETVGSMVSKVKTDGDSSSSSSSSSSKQATPEEIEEKAPNVATNVLNASIYEIAKMEELLNRLQGLHQATVDINGVMKGQPLSDFYKEVINSLQITETAVNENNNSGLLRNEAYTNASKFKKYYDTLSRDLVKLLDSIAFTSTPSLSSTLSNGAVLAGIPSKFPVPADRNGTAEFTIKVQKPKGTGGAEDVAFKLDKGKFNKNYNTIISTPLFNPKRSLETSKSIGNTIKSLKDLTSTMNTDIKSVTKWINDIEKSIKDKTAKGGTGLNSAVEKNSGNVLKQIRGGISASQTGTKYVNLLIQEVQAVQGVVLSVEELRNKYLNKLLKEKGNAKDAQAAVDKTTTLKDNM